jgi:hypothetical protein
MNIELKNSILVVVGQFNPLEFDRYFFIKNGFFLDEDISDKSIFSDFQAHLVATNFSLTVNKDRLQLADLSNESKYVLVDIAIKLLQLLKKPTVINAVGINFHWFLSDNNSSIESISKKVFYSKEIPLFENFFNNDDVAFGTYVSKNVKDSRLKLEVRPIIAINIKNQIEQQLLQWIFNFHIQLPESTTHLDTIKYIQDFEYYKNESFQIISIVKL